MNQSKTAEAAADLEKAIAAGDKSANTAGNLAYSYYLMGNYEKSLLYSAAALKTSPNELWIKFDHALTLLAAGKIDEARAVYDEGMQIAASEVARAKESNSEPPSFLWEAMIDAADSLEGAVDSVSGTEGAPGNFVNPDALKTEGEKILVRLKSTAVALEYTGKPPADKLTAVISPLRFLETVKDDQGKVTGYKEPAETFANGLDEFAVEFNYQGMKDGQEVIFKLYNNGVEDPSWRIIEPWKLGESGVSEYLISYAYSDTFTFSPGQYTVELYVDHNLAQRGFFTIQE
jgi:tetratricopeptide (TPR) repeat protein